LAIQPLWQVGPRSLDTHRLSPLHQPQRASDTHWPQLGSLSQVETTVLLVLDRLGITFRG
jgi:hypothetical protein